MALDLSSTGIVGVFDYNALTSRDIPNSVTELYLPNNQITEIKNIPRSIDCLHLSNNQITHISQHIPVTLDIHHNIPTIQKYTKQELSDFTRCYDIYDVLSTYKIHCTTNIIQQYLRIALPK